MKPLMTVAAVVVPPYLACAALIALAPAAPTPPATQIAAAGDHSVVPLLMDVPSDKLGALKPSFFVPQLTPHDVQSGPGCVDEDDRICSPDNVRHVPAGCYDDGGVLFAPWPCTAWEPADGYQHGDGSWTPSGYLVTISRHGGGSQDGGHTHVWKHSA